VKPSPSAAQPHATGCNPSDRRKSRRKPAVNPTVRRISAVYKTNGLDVKHDNRFVRANARLKAPWNAARPSCTCGFHVASQAFRSERRLFASSGMNTPLSSENFRFEIRVLFGFSDKPTSKLLSWGKITSP